ASSTGSNGASPSAYASTASVVNTVPCAYASAPACSAIAAATSTSPCPIPTTIAPPDPSRYRFPSASVIHTPSPRTATGAAGNMFLPNTWLIGTSVSQRHLQLQLVVHGDPVQAGQGDARLQLAAPVHGADAELGQ